MDNPKNYPTKQSIPVLFDLCGCCGHYHTPTFAGDCREDAERFSANELDDHYGQNGWLENDTTFIS